MSQISESFQPNTDAQGNAAQYGDFQIEIYGAGLRGITPSFPVSPVALEKQATAAMPPQVLSYVQGGCGDEFTQQQNVEAFNRWGLIPRCGNGALCEKQKLRKFAQPYKRFSTRVRKSAHPCDD